MFSTIRTEVAVTWLLTDPWGDTVYRQTIQGVAEGARGPSGGKKQTARRIERALQDLYVQSVRSLTASWTASQLSNAASWLPIVIGAAQGDSALVDSLLAVMVDPNAADSAGRTPLMAAAWNGQHEIVHILLKKGADVSRTDNSGRTALTYATAAGSSEAHEILTVAEAENDWRLANAVNTDVAFETFLNKHETSRYAAQASDRLNALRDEEAKRLSGLEQYRNAFARAFELEELSLKPSDLISNMIVRKAGGVVTVYGIVPSQSAAVPIDTTTFIVRRISDFPQLPRGITVHCNDTEAAIGSVSGSDGSLTVVIPRELLPCTLALRADR